MYYSFIEIIKTNYKYLGDEILQEISEKYLEVFKEISQNNELIKKFNECKDLVEFEDEFINKFFEIPDVTFKNTIAVRDLFDARLKNYELTCDELNDDLEKNGSYYLISDINGHAHEQLRLIYSILRENIYDDLKRFLWVYSCPKNLDFIKKISGMFGFSNETVYELETAYIATLYCIYIDFAMNRSCKSYSYYNDNNYIEFFDDMTEYIKDVELKNYKVFKELAKIFLSCESTGALKNIIQKNKNVLEYIYTNTEHILSYLLEGFKKEFYNDFKIYYNNRLKTQPI